MRHSPGMFGNIKATYMRHGRSLRHMGFWAMAIYHYGRWALNLRSALLRRLAGMLYGLLSFALELACGIWIPREVVIGENFHLVHGWNIKMHPKVVIGDRVGIMHDVTLGTTPDDPGPPTIGNDVYIGVGARILGAVKIGDGARIAANSLVISDVPPGTTAVGVPARILRYTGRGERAASESDSGS